MTRKLTVILTVTFAAISGASAQNSGDAAQSLLNLENTWVDALVKTDITKLDAILLDTFVDTDEEGHRSDKRGVLAALKSGDLKMVSIKLSDMRVHAYGSSAVVTGAAAQTGAYKGQSLAPMIVFTDTFVLHDGKWKVVASHRSAVHR